MTYSTSADLRARSRIDPYDPNPYDPCWHFLGSLVEGRPKIWTFDYDLGDKRCMCGTRAVWSISRGRSPGDKLVYRTCFTTDCVNPGHHALAADKAQIGRAVAASGKRKGTHVEARKANAAKARERLGIISTPIEIVRAIRAADPRRTNVALSRELNVAHQTVSAIRNGQRRRAAA